MVIVLLAILNMVIRMGNEDYHGDEPEIEAHQRMMSESYAEEHADDWKYYDERIFND